MPLTFRAISKSHRRHAEEAASGISSYGLMQRHMGCGAIMLAIGGMMNGATAAPVTTPAGTGTETSPASTQLAASAADASVAQPYRSAMDMQLMYQLLVSEISVRQGDPGTGYQLMLDAARRNKDDQLYRRAVDIALRAQAGEQALSAARAWRTASPGSRDAAEFSAQILLALNRPAEAVEPLRSVITLTPANERSKVISAVPATLARLSDKKLAADLVDEVVQPFRSAPQTSAACSAASGRARMAASDFPKALQGATEALNAEPTNEAAALLAVDLMGTRPEAENLVQHYLEGTTPSIAVRLAYGRRLAETSRMAEAAQQLEAVTRANPSFAGAWLSLGAARAELHELDAAEAALKRFIALRDKPAAAVAPSGASATAASAPSAAPKADEGTANGDASNDADVADGDTAIASNLESLMQGDDQIVQAYLLLSQVAEERGQFAAAQAWLEKIPASTTRALAVQIRRASVLARQGHIDQARAVIRKAPAGTDQEVRGKLMAEALLLRDASRWKESYSVFTEANRRFPDDTELLYQQAMVAEKLASYDDMERKLRRVIELDPEHYNAYNALGFSLAERNQRLPEAKKLIQKAMELSANDPYIVDSLGWVEFRLGNMQEARSLLSKAFQVKRDTEIAAHLGEVMWAQGDHEEARRLLREAKQKDAGNATLQDTLKRLKVGL